MTNSAATLVLRNTEQEVWKRGQEYADSGRVVMQSHDDEHVRAVVHGSQTYTVNLRLASNRVRLECDCPYFTRHRNACKHIVAVALVWDASRGIQPPSSVLVQHSTIPPPRLSRSDINHLFRNPLQANLDQVRILAEETALGGRARSHSQLPKMPRIEIDVNQPLTLKEVRSCWTEIRKWSRRSAFDPYFCAGEMVAAFCEVPRIVTRRLPATPLLDGARILLKAQEFNTILVTELVDDSQGLHEISEAHLDELHRALQESAKTQQEDRKVRDLLEQFRQRRGVY